MFEVIKERFLGSRPINTSGEKDLVLRKDKPSNEPRVFTYTVKEKEGVIFVSGDGGTFVGYRDGSWLGTQDEAAGGESDFVSGDQAQLLSEIARRGLAAKDGLVAFYPNETTLEKGL